MGSILVQGREMLYSDEDQELVASFKWVLSPTKTSKRAYAATNKKINGKWRKVYLHHMIVTPHRGFQVDHINGNALDNRRSNLRIVTPYENAQNKRPKEGRRFKGVRITKDGTYRVSISKAYKSEIEAAQVYNELAKMLFGEFAWLNQIENNTHWISPEVEG